MFFFNKYTFKGGIHPPDNKKLSAEKAIEVFPVPKKVYLPMGQHIGAPAEPVVKVGDSVEIGQKIGQASGFVSSNIHSSINGTVKEIKPYLSPVGKKINTIVIESHEEQEPVLNPQDDSSVEKLSTRELLEIVKDSGIVGLGGATFPTHVKLKPPQGKKIEYLVINAAECEPYLTCDYRIMLEKQEQMLKGIEILGKILGVSEIFIGIEKNKPIAIQELKKKVNDDKIKIIPLEIKYPQGAEKQLIYSILKKEVPSGGLPLDVGVVVQNVGTALAIYEAVYLGKNLYERVITVSGKGIQTPKNLLVRLGTPVSEIIEYCGGLTEGVTRVVNGGPMMGISLFDLSVPVIKGTSGILALTEKESKLYEPGPCISCGGCVDVCPMRLMPTFIMRYTKKDQWDEAEKNNAMDCIECGCCSYVCPAKINLVHYIRYAKSEIISIRRKAQLRKGALNGK